MLQVMRDDEAETSRRDEMAKAAAPFLHPRLAAIERKTPGLDLSKLTENEINFLEGLYERYWAPRL
jgi:hypothetical protein